MSVVIFNGPPGSGKDALAEHFVQRWGFRHQRFKYGLVPLVLRAYRVTADWFDAHYTRELKEQPCHELAGMSPRQALINMSEQVIKPAFGEAAFGIMAARRLDKTARTVFSDGGFVDELEPVVAEIGADNVLIVRLVRPGHSFAQDSRAYYPDHVLGCRTVTLHNTGSLAELFICAELICRLGPSVGQ
jgi:hypothetical protein